MKKSKVQIKNKTDQFHILLLLLLIIVPISLCFNNSVWLDEAFSLRWSTFPYDEMMGRLTNDVHPPLYYFALRVLLFLTGKSLLAAKLFSVLGLFFILFTGYRFLKSRFGNQALYVFWLFILFTPRMLQKSVEVRMYTWAYLFVLLSFLEIYMLLTLPMKKNWIRFTIFSLLAAYTQYFALITMVFVYGILLVFFVFSKNWKQCKNWFLCSLFTVVGYSPWLPTAIRQMQGNSASWIQQPANSLDPILELFQSDLHGSEYVFTALIFISMAASVISFLKKKDGDSYWTMASFVPLWGCLIFGLVYGELYKPILTSRYLMIPLSILIVGLSSLFRNIPRVLTMIVCFFFLLVGVVTYQNVFEEEYNTLTDETLAFAEKYFEETDTIVTDASVLCSVIPYYFPKSNSVNDIYTDQYEAAWYLDSSGTLDLNRLKEDGVEVVNYGVYGFDKVNFLIYHLNRK